MLISDIFFCDLSFIQMLSPSFRSLFQSAFLSLLSFSSLYCSTLTRPHFFLAFLVPPPLLLRPPFPPLFSLTCGKHYILSGGERERAQTSQSETESFLGRPRGSGQCQGLYGGDSRSLSLRPHAVWIKKGGFVFFNAPQHPIAGRLHPPSALDWRTPWRKSSQNLSVQAPAPLTHLSICQVNYM